MTSSFSSHAQRQNSGQWTFLIEIRSTNWRRTVSSSDTTALTSHVLPHMWTPMTLWLHTRMPVCNACGFSVLSPAGYRATYRPGGGEPSTSIARHWEQSTLTTRLRRHQSLRWSATERASLPTNKPFTLHSSHSINWKCQCIEFTT